MKFTSVNLVLVCCQAKLSPYIESWKDVQLGGSEEAEDEHQANYFVTEFGDRKL